MRRSDAVEADQRICHAVTADRTVTRISGKRQRIDSPELCHPLQPATRAPCSASCSHAIESAATARRDATSPRLRRRRPEAYALAAVRIMASHGAASISMRCITPTLSRPYAAPGLPAPLPETCRSSSSCPSELRRAAAQPPIAALPRDHPFMVAHGLRTRRHDIMHIDQPSHDRGGTMTLNSGSFAAGECRDRDDHRLLPYSAAIAIEPQCQHRA